MSDRVMQRALRIIDIARRRCDRCEYINLYTGYAEPGYTDPECGVIAVGNLNVVTEWKDGGHTVIDDTPERLGNILGKMGVDTEWSDEWDGCGCCGKLVRLRPDSMWWKPSYQIVDGCELICHACIKKGYTVKIPKFTQTETELLMLKAIDSGDRTVADMLYAFADLLEENNDPRTPAVREIMTLLGGNEYNVIKRYNAFKGKGEMWTVFNSDHQDPGAHIDALWIPTDWFENLECKLCYGYSWGDKRDTIDLNNWRDYPKPSRLLADVIKAWLKRRAKLEQIPDKSTANDAI